MRTLFRDPARILALIGAVLMIAGSPLPWYRIGTRRWSGLDEGADGAILLGLGVLIVVLVTIGHGLLTADVPPARYLLLGVGVIAGGLSITAFVAVRVTVARAQGVGSFESGLFVAGIGALMTAAGGAVFVLRESRRPR